MYHMTFSEVFKGVTYNAAKAINRELEIGLFKEGYNADLLFWDIDDIHEIPYWFNSEKLFKVIKNGKLVNF